MLRVIYLLLFGLSFSSLFAQNFWQEIDINSFDQSMDRSGVQHLENYTTYRLDITSINKMLERAPKEFSNEPGLLLDLPMPDGSFKKFSVVQSPIMEEGLAEKYPDIHTYKGWDLHDKETNVRFDISQKGFRASFRGNQSIYIDPVSKDMPGVYAVYHTKDYKEDVSAYNLTCGLDPYDILDEDLKDQDKPDPVDLPDPELKLRSNTICDSVPMFTYRLALSCTGEWASSHGGTKESVLADMVTSINRINQIYENEFSIRLLLIADNDKVIFLDKETDPFPVANVGYELLGVNTQVLNNTVGLDSYDVGHVFTRSCTDVGGVASLGSVCSDGRKGSAVTCHYSNNLNYIITNVMAHEMGHQFSAQHTFNNCDGNESAGHDYEPGGGVTIMAYCGLCGSNNVDYTCLENFHGHSIEQVRSFTRMGAGSLCSTELSTGNTAPVVELDYKNGFSIPIGTPFILDGSVYDCEGDQVTYSWEEWDLGPTFAPVGEPIEDTPIFTAQEPKDVSYRVFPAMNKIINNFSNNSEILPDYTRAMNFRLIARDNNPNGGGSGWANVSFQAHKSAGPFSVTYPNQTSTFEVGQEVEIQWDVADTDNAIVNCQNVNILLSTDAGYNYPHLLKYNTPNDGAETITVPNNLTSLGRFKIEAADNIFFDISNNYTKIIEPETATYAIDAGPVYQMICLPDVAEIQITTAGFKGYMDTLRFESGAGLPEGATVRFIPETVVPGENVVMEIDLTEVNSKERYNVEVISISTSEDTLSRFFELDVVSNDYSDLEIVQPLPGSSGNKQLFEFSWLASQSADEYNIYLSDSPSFPEESTEVLLNTEETVFLPENTLEKSKIYYWKIEGINECGLRPATEIMTFATEAFSCKTFVSEDVEKDIRSFKTTTSTITIDEETTVADVNITKIAGDHDHFHDLEAHLIGPDSTSVILFASRCLGFDALDFNFGMDDESSHKFSCPPYSSVFYPAGKLADFIGKSAKGDWILSIYDAESPKGGDLDEFELEICANSVLSNPFLVNNKEYRVAIGIDWNLPTSKLRAEDDDNSSEELQYTLVKLPDFASILKDGLELNVGDSFTEQEIRDGKLDLYSNGTHDLEDGFDFVISDGNGGWLKKTRFSFIHDEFVDVNDLLTDSSVKVFPNPGEGLFNLHVMNKGTFEMEIFDLQGKRILTKTLNGLEREKIDLEGYKAGIYILKLQDQHQSFVKKLIKH